MQSNPKSLFFQYLAQTSPEPMALEIASAKGNYLFDAQGNRYLDLIAGISVCNVGHQHPQVVSAIEEQLHKHLHVMVYGETVQSVQSGYGEALVNKLPESLNNVYFTNSGAEAIDAAMKLAKRVTGKFGFCSSIRFLSRLNPGPTFADERFLFYGSLQAIAWTSVFY